MDKVSSWEKWINNSPVMQNLAPKNRTLINGLFELGAQFVRKIFGRR